MLKKAIKIPTFKSFRDEAEFWDTHSLADYWAEFKDVDIVVELHKPAKETLVLRVQKSLKKQLEQAAKKKRISVSSLSRIWLTEKLQSLHA